MVSVDTLLAWGAAYRKISPGEIIFQEGSEAHFYYQLVSGSVRLINVDDNGNEFIQDMIQAGGSFGEFSLFDSMPYAATATANMECMVLRLHKESFLQMIKEHPELYLAFTRLLTEKLRFKYILLKEVSRYGPEHRITTLFDYFKEAKKNVCKNCSQILLTRQQIADMTGLRVETVIRAIKHLQGKGKLTIDKGKVFT
jgi:CRP-like cAMP-binding protein